jgi:hypothetical protein
MLIGTEESSSRKEPSLYVKLLVQIQYWCYSSVSRNQDGSLGIATGRWLKDRCSNSGRGKILLFSTAFKPALGPTQPHIQWVPGAFSLGVKAADMWSWPLTSI